jgi:hypothetical protein
MKFLYMDSEPEEFEFSTSNPLFTRDQILGKAKGSSENLVLACLNSKPAMVGACLAAMELPSIQLVYAQPLFYNVAAYSQGSNKILQFPIPLFG